ncbi:dynein axonemal intermediate chain 3 [Dunckerocampus dactyliophorus]|uniref:dynein axonemal intermediate chain 3 n=1 Tax=Dunckerocampus dactyliophorus TaxID=161453 RepID=UPI002404FE90|nr:dynein axonemal intermediate chain 3 [Dunckerocampus dactyliophorus]
MPSKTSSANSAGSRGNDPDHPEDIIPMVLTSATQELFGCRADEDVTGENPYKLLKKDDILEDMKTKAAVSDFSPVKQIILDYPESELLLVFDRDFTYGQCFYLVVTPEAKERILNPPEPEPEEDFNEIIKTPEPKEWISLGSEQEIDEESVRETRAKLLYKFSRARKEFGMPVSFSDRNVADAKDGNVECASYQDRRFNINLMQRDCGVQAIPILQSSSAQTQWKYMRNNCTQYTPAELNQNEKDKTQEPQNLSDFCKTVTGRVLHALQQEDIMNVFKDDWMDLGTETEDTDWSGKVSDILMLYQAFADQKYTQDKGISCMHWHPTIHGVIAVSLTEKTTQQSTRSTGPLIAFYSFSDPTHAKILLECPDEILAFEFCPSDPNIIVGGCLNGQVVLWEISAYVPRLLPVPPGAKHESVKTGMLDLEDKKGSNAPIARYSAMSGVENSHTGPITDVHWLPPTFEVTAQGMPVENKYNISVQLITCSPDGSLMFWDIRVSKQLRQMVSDKKQNDSEPQMANYSDNNPFKHLERSWKPLFKVSTVNMDPSREYAPLKFCLDHYSRNNASISENAEDHEPVPDYSQLQMPSGKGLTPLEDVNTKIYIGTEEGEIVYTDWKLVKNDLDQLLNPKPLHCFRIHPCLVNTIDRSPFFKDIILTGTSLYGTCNIAIWKEGVLDGPLFLLPSLEGLCTVACWSLTRPAFFFVGKGDGKIEVWNLLEKTGEAMHVQEHMSNGKITCIEPKMVSSKQHFLAVADDVGVVRVFQIPPVFYTASRNEKLNMGKCIDQQQARLTDLLMRRELWQNQPTLEENKKVEPKKPESSTEETDEMKEYDDFLVLEESVLKGMGLTP